MRVICYSALKYVHEKRGIEIQEISTFMRKYVSGYKRDFAIHKENDPVSSEEGESD